ncbi:MAG: adenosine kinase [Bacteroidales bacterium]|jgi:sugar/nucleoside kinase (ribokinase family)|nr:adenosine kinase [Bacteroidales bacterium]
MTKILGIGNALTDILIRLDDDLQLNKLGLEKASMFLVDKDKADEILKFFNNKTKEIVSGGSACNAIHNIARLGLETGYIGKIGHDEYGQHYVNDLKKAGIKSQMFYSEALPSGTAIAMISPDSERTFTTYLGASLELHADDLHIDYFKGYDIIHLEGYLVQNHELVRRAIILAKKAGLKISADLPGFNVIKEDNDFVLEMIDSLDIVFANEEEAKAIFNKTPEETLAFLASKCEYAFVKLGANGSLAQHHNEKVRVEAKKVNAIDATGAGDAYAAGALYGISKGFDTYSTGKIGAVIAENVIQTIGPKLSEKMWENIKEELSI